MDEIETTNLVHVGGVGILAPFLNLSEANYQL